MTLSPLVLAPKTYIICLCNYLSISIYLFIYLSITIYLSIYLSSWLYTYLYLSQDDPSTPSHAYSNLAALAKLDEMQDKGVGGGGGWAVDHNLLLPDLDRGGLSRSMSALTRNHFIQHIDIQLIS